MNSLTDPSLAAQTSANIIIEHPDGSTYLAWIATDTTIPPTTDPLTLPIWRIQLIQTTTTPEGIKTTQILWADGNRLFNKTLAHYDTYQYRLG